MQARPSRRAEKKLASLLDDVIMSRMKFMYSKQFTSPARMSSVVDGKGYWLGFIYFVYFFCRH